MTVDEYDTDIKSNVKSVNLKFQDSQKLSKFMYDYLFIYMLLLN